MEPKREPKTVKNLSKFGSKKRSENGGPDHPNPGPTRETIQPDKTTQNQQDTYRTCRHPTEERLSSKKNLTCLTRLGRPQARSGYIGPNGPPGFPAFVSNLAASGFRTGAPAPFWVPGGSRGSNFVILVEVGVIYLPILSDFH